jgi:hypothetical protein
MFVTQLIYTEKAPALRIALKKNSAQSEATSSIYYASPLMYMVRLFDEGRYADIGTFITAWEREFLAEHLTIVSDSMMAQTMSSYDEVVQLSLSHVSPDDTSHYAMINELIDTIHGNHARFCSLLDYIDSVLSNPAIEPHEADFAIADHVGSNLDLSALLWGSVGGKFTDERGNVIRIGLLNNAENTSGSSIDSNIDKIINGLSYASQRRFMSMGNQISRDMRAYLARAERVSAEARQKGYNEGFRNGMSLIDIITSNEFTSSGWSIEEIMHSGETNKYLVCRSPAIVEYINYRNSMFKIPDGLKGALQLNAIAIRIENEISFALGKGFNPHRMEVNGDQMRIQDQITSDLWAPLCLGDMLGKPLTEFKAVHDMYKIIYFHSMYNGTASNFVSLLFNGFTCYDKEGHQIPFDHVNEDIANLPAEVYKMVDKQTGSQYTRTRFINAFGPYIKYMGSLIRTSDNTQRGTIFNSSE